jgi:hypothetical protein
LINLFGWARRFRPGPDNSRLEQFRQVLLAALQTRGYRPWLERAGIGDPTAIAALTSIEETLWRLPCLPWEEFRGSPDDFRNREAPTPPRRPLRSSVGQGLRIAVLDDRITETRAVRVFRPDWIDQIRRFRPAAIAAPIIALPWLMKSASVAVAPTHAVIVLAGIEHGAMPEADRENLWRIFEVPIFEQCLAPDGSLLAWECEAHQGLHFGGENAIFEQGEQSELIVTSLTDQSNPVIRLTTRLTARFECEPCECGLAGKRLIGLSALQAAPRKRAAAAAG